jgi:hypothetical protein
MLKPMRHPNSATRTFHDVSGQREGCSNKAQHGCLIADFRPKAPQSLAYIWHALGGYQWGHLVDLLQ